jgi:hypothetical protein
VETKMGRTEAAKERVEVMARVVTVVEVTVAEVTVAEGNGSWKRRWWRRMGTWW